MSAAVSVENLSFAYRTWPFRAPVRALESVSLEVREGGAHALLGSNGAGKTTLLRHLAGLHPSGRQVSVLGAPADSSSVRSRVGFLPESGERSSRVRVQDVLLLEATLHEIPAHDRAARIRTVLEEVGMAEHSRRPLRTLSTGQRRRVALAQLLLPDSALLLLDEPFSGIDPLWTLRLCDSLRRRVAAGATLVFSTHRLDDVEAVAETLTLFDAGKVVAEGSLDTILSMPGEWLAHVRSRTDCGASREELDRWIATAPVSLQVELRPRRRTLVEVLRERSERRE